MIKILLTNSNRLINRHHYYNPIKYFSEQATRIPFKLADIGEGNTYTYTYTYTYTSTYTYTYTYTYTIIIKVLLK